MAKGTESKTHVVIPGIVNVEHTIITSHYSLDGRVREAAGTKKPGSERGCSTMTSRRCTVLEQGACERLRLDGYEVRILPVGQNQQRPLAHLIARKGSEETRYISIRKCSHRSASIDAVEQCGRQDILRYRSDRARHPVHATIRYEIWLYTLQHGYLCFDILPDSIQEIPQREGKIAVRMAVGDAS